MAIASVRFAIRAGELARRPGAAVVLPVGTEQLADARDDVVDQVRREDLADGVEDGAVGCLHPDPLLVRTDRRAAVEV
jgi:hypothetical protein